MDASGTIESVGPDVDRLIPGEEVMAAVSPRRPEGGAQAQLLNAAALGAIRDGGGLAVVRGWDGRQPERGINIVAVMVASALQRTDWLEHLRALALDGRLQLRVAGTYAPEQAAEAHRAVEAGGLRGRALIVF